MRKLIAYLLLVFFLFNGKNLIGQEWWNRYSKQEREKILLEKAKEAVLKYSDERYYTTRIGYKIDSSILFKEIAGERKREVYRVFFLYDSTKVRFVRKYLAKAIIPKDTCEVIFLTL